MKYKLIQKRPLYRGFFHLDAYEVEHERFDGGMMHMQREHLKSSKAIAILLYDKRYDEVLLIEQFRIGAAVADDKAWLIEVVAGMIDQGESAEEAAHREAVEEAGYAPKSLQLMGQYYATPGGSSEHITLYFGEVDKDKPVGQGGGVAGEHEDIRPFWIAKEEAMRWVLNGKINSGAPMLALLLAFGHQGLVKDKV